VSGLIAAGAVLWRPASSGAVEVAVVHRPRYDDWSWPKGKPRSGEPLPLTAAREIEEETGHRAVLGRRMAGTRYPVAAGEKVAHYWAARAKPGTFVPSDEVDEMRWLPPAQARELLSYPHDQTLLADLEAATSATGTILLVRHAKAGKREHWAGDDDLRPLTAVGKQQAEELREVLPLFGAERIYSAPRTRCHQTVEGLAEDLGVPVLDEPLLSEEDYLADPEGGLAKIVEIAAEPGGPAVVCSQGGVIPDVLHKLADQAGLPLSDMPPRRKASFWALSFGVRANDETVLLAADYYDAPGR
jgi:8-oxo-dGTP diphosphatase